MTDKADRLSLRAVLALAGVGLVALAAPPLAASAGVGPEDRRAVIVYSPFAAPGEGWRAALAAGGRPVAQRFDGRLVLAGYDGADGPARFRAEGAWLLLDAALLEKCGAF